MEDIYLSDMQNCVKVFCESKKQTYLLRSANQIFTNDSDQFIKVLTTPNEFVELVVSGGSVDWYLYHHSESDNKPSALFFVFRHSFPNGDY